MIDESIGASSYTYSCTYEKFRYLEIVLKLVARGAAKAAAVDRATAYIQSVFFKTYNNNKKGTIVLSNFYLHFTVIRYVDIVMMAVIFCEHKSWNFII